MNIAPPAGEVQSNPGIQSINIISLSAISTRVQAHVKPWKSYLFLLLFFLALLGPIFRPGWLISDAHPSRMAEIYAEYNIITQQGWFAGWNWRLQGGMPVGTYQYQLTYLIICGLGLLDLPLATGYKIVFLGSMWLSAALVLRLMRRYMDERLALGMTFSFFLCSAIHFQIAQGFWNHLLGLGLLAWFISRLDETEKLDRHSAPSLILIYALIVLTHEYTAIAAGIILLAWLPRFWRSGGRHSLVWWLMLPLGAILLTAPYTLPIMQTHHHLVHVTGEEHSLRYLLKGVLVLTGFYGAYPYASLSPADRLIMIGSEWPAILACGLAIAVMLRWRKLPWSEKEKRFGLSVLIALGLFAMINVKLISILPIMSLRRITGQLIADRFLQYSHLMIFLLAGMMIQYWLRQGKTRPVLKRKAMIALTAMLVLTGVKTIISLHRNHRLETTSTFEERKDVTAVWKWLRENDDGRRRILYETPYDNYPIRNGQGRGLNQSTIMALSSLETGMPGAGELLNLVLPMHERTRTANGRIMNVKLDEAKPRQIDPLLKEGNFGWIVACSPAMHDWLALHPLMKRMERFGEFAIYKYAGAPASWASLEHPGPLLVDIDPQNDARMEVRVDNPAANNRLTVRMSWHPFWRAWINDQPLELSANDYGNIQAVLPDTGRQTIRFEYNARFEWQIKLALVAWACLITFWLTVNAQPREDQARPA